MRSLPRRLAAPLALLLLLPVLFAGCGGASRALDREQALNLAIELANAKAFEGFNRKPFSPGDAEIRFEEGEWRWGDLNAAGPHGFSASVAFDARGEDPRAEVAFNVDAIKSLY